MKKKTILLLFLLILSIYALNLNVQSVLEENNYRPTSLELTPHDPISITSDGNFTDYSFLGSGTEVDPYVIEGYNITTTDNSGIYINGTTKYFTIRNCHVDAKYDGIRIDNVAEGTATVINNTCNNNDDGISLSSSVSSTVANNTCTNNNYGIHLSSSSGSSLTNNNCSNNNWFGIYLTGSSNSTFTDNTCNNNGNKGISLKDSSSSTITNNTCSNNSDYGINLYSSGSSTVANNTCSYNNDYSIRLEDSGNSIVANNTCSNNDYGISLWFSGNSTVANNTFANCGLHIIEYTVDTHLLYTVENNWVNGKKLGYYTNLDSTIIAEPVYGQLILINCTRVTVRDQILNNASTGLFLYYCTYSVIINNTCSNNNNYGIYLWSSRSSTVANNTCTNNKFGISLFGSRSSTVADNTCNDNGYRGISLSYSSSSTVANNTCSNNDYGISLRSSYYSTVANNTCSNNDYGISLYYSSSSTVTNNTCSDNGDGISLYDFSSSNVLNNTCSDNNRYGIFLMSSDFCVVTYNLLQENGEYGICFFTNSDNNIIHHNTFVDNNPEGTSQAKDDGTKNTWYDPETKEGNYWSDWSGTGSYSIDGTVNSEDFYPLDEPAEYSTDENQLFFTFTLLIVIVPLILTRIISKKKKKEKSN